MVIEKEVVRVITQNIAGKRDCAQRFFSLNRHESTFVEPSVGEQDKLCLICDEICPYDVLSFGSSITSPAPSNDRLCLRISVWVAAGVEHNCPTGGRAAIEVHAIGEERFAKGTYITEQKKKMREIKDTHESSYNADEIGSGGKNSEGKRTAPSAQPQNPSVEEEKLPDGFLLE